MEVFKISSLILLNEGSGPWSQLGTLRSPPRQLPCDGDLPELEGTLETSSWHALRSGPSSSSTAVPSKVFVFSFGRPQSWSKVGGEVETGIKGCEMDGEGWSLFDGRRYLSS